MSKRRPRRLLVNVCAAFAHHASCSEGRRLVNFVKRLTVPAVLLLSGVMAVPAFGAEATISNLQTACNSDHRVCFSFNVATQDFDASGRDILVDLMDANTSTVLAMRTEHLAADTLNV